MIRTAMATNSTAVQTSTTTHRHLHFLDFAVVFDFLLFTSWALTFGPDGGTHAGLNGLSGSSSPHFLADASLFGLS